MYVTMFVQNIFSILLIIKCAQWICYVQNPTNLKLRTNQRKLYDKFLF